MTTSLQRIAIHSVPRSGSTWVGCIFDAHPALRYKYQPLWSYRFKDRVTVTSSTEAITAFFNELAVTEDDFIDQIEAKSRGSIPTFTKEEPTTVAYKEVRYHYLLPHLLKQDQHLKFIGLIRNPIEVLNSWLNAPKEFRADLGWKVEDEWLRAPSKNLDKPEEYNGYLKWKETTELFLELKNIYPERVKLIEYKDLIDNPLKGVMELYNWCGLEIHQQVVDFIHSSRTVHKTDAYSVFRSKSSQGQSRKLPKEAMDYIHNDLKGTEMEVYLS